MHTFFILLLSVALWLFSGCSSKEVFEPEHISGEWERSGNLDEAIIDTTSDGALLEDGQILTHKGILKKKLPEGYRFIGESGGWIIAGKIDGELQLISSDEGNKTIIFELKKTVAAASVQDDILAVLFASNEMALYSLSSKLPVFTEEGSPPIAVDSRIINPHFLNELVLFLTLDGKIVIVNSESKTTLRTIIVSTEDHFNNIIYFKMTGNNMVAATSYRLFAMAEKENRESYELRDVIYNDEGIWISTKQGEVISMTPSLQLKAKQKFPFAHFLGMIVSEKKIYLLEKEGYLIILDKDMIEYEIYEIEIDEGFVFVSDKSFYFDDDYVTVE